MYKRQDYLQLEQLGTYASSIAPFSDWESLTMEALIGMGRYEEAGSLYAETVDRYFKERGIRPSQKLMAVSYTHLHTINAIRAHDTENIWFSNNGIAGLVFLSLIHI